MALTLCVLTSGITQTGPGGVGTNDGSSNLEFWYIANLENFSDGDLVDRVYDRSGNGRSLTAAGAERPTYVSSATGINDQSSFTFTANQELETTYQGNSNENMSFGIMMNGPSTTAVNVAIQHGGRNTLSVRNGFCFDFIGGSNHTSTTDVTNTWVYHSKIVANTGTNRLKFYINNTNTDNFNHNIENRTSNTWIGGHGSGGGTGFQGGIAEVFKFSRVLNDVEQIIIANYFSAKYNIALTTNDIYNEDDAASGNFDFDVAGIGRIDALNIHDDSQGTGIVRIQSPTNLDDDEFLFWGHNNATQLATETTDVPLDVQARFERVWRVSETTSSTSPADVGAINISFDLSSFDPVVGSDLRLLVDTNNNGSFSDDAPISGALDMGSGVFQFVGVTAISDNLRFTLGTIDIIQTPLPVELTNFTATPVNNRVVNLEWYTSSEMNNDYFSVERSKDGTTWEALERIEGEGNSNYTMRYFLVDEYPLNGTSYYRLKQTDYDGRFEYSSIEKVTLDKLNDNKVYVFPNPTNSILTIDGTLAELESIIIYDQMGRNVTAFAREMVSNETTVVYDLSQFMAGIYYIKTKTTATSISISKD